MGWGENGQDGNGECAGNVHRGTEEKVEKKRGF